MNNATLQRNESEALRSERRGGREEEVEPRILSTVRSPSAERTSGLQGQTLPVVEEFGEASSTGGRSGSRERPATPAKDGDYSPSLNGYAGGMGRTVKGAVPRSSLDKELPPLPMVGTPSGGEE
jgi:1-phosphatidylinositol-4-phosphate 5-kinase